MPAIAARGGGAAAAARRRAELGLDARRQMAEQGEVGGHPVALGRIMGAAQLLQPAIVAVAEQGGDDEGRGAAQISTWLPSSTTRLGGSLKNSIALSALRSIQANSFSRQIAMPGLRGGDQGLAGEEEAGVHHLDVAARSSTWRARRARRSPA